MSCKPTVKELREYEKLVDDLIERNSSTEFHNALTEHAQIIIKKFFTKAEKSVNVLCKNLAAEVYGTDVICSAIEKALKNKVSVNILVQNDPETSSFEQWFTSLDSALKERISVRKVEAGSDISTWPFNFTIMDGESYRFEEDCSKHKAKAAIRGGKIAEDLSEVFNYAKSLKNTQLYT